MMFVKFNGLCYQLIAGFAASLSAMSAGVAFGWITMTLPYLLSQESEVPMTKEEASWMVTMPQFGNLLSPIPAVVLADRMGRKIVILISGPIFLIGWAIIIHYKSILALNIARFIQGLGVGIVYAVVPMYLAEITVPKYRGVVINLFFSLYVLGYLFEYVTGDIFSFMPFTYVTALINIVFIVTFIWQPESPYFYILNGDDVKAEQSLNWFLRTSKEHVNLELVNIKISLKKDIKNKASWKDLLMDPTTRKCLLIALLSSFVKNFCGIIPLAVYANDTLFIEGTRQFLSPKNLTIGIGVMMFVGVSANFLIIDYLGRKFSFFLSCFLSAICMFMVGTFYLLKSHTNLNLTPINWVPAVGMIIFAATSLLGIFPVSIIYQTELFDSSTRAAASSIITIFNPVMLMIPNLTYLEIQDVLGTYVNFYIFFLVCLLGTIVSFTVLPETKNKSFQQIRYEMQRKTDTKL